LEDSNRNCRSFDSVSVCEVHKLRPRIEEPNLHYMQLPETETMVKRKRETSGRK